MHSSIVRGICGVAMKAELCRGGVSRQQSVLRISVA